MKQIASFLAALLVHGLSCGGLAARSLPAIPPSTRILTTEQVKNYWINSLQHQPVPSKPSGLHPEQQSAWRRNLESLESLIRSVRNGERDTDAKLAQLRHNADAWHQLGNEPEAEAAETKLRVIQGYLALMETLEMQRKAAQSQIDAAERLKGIEAEIAALRASCIR